MVFRPHSRTFLWKRATGFAAVLLAGALLVVAAGPSVAPPATRSTSNTPVTTSAEGATPLLELGSNRPRVLALPRRLISLRYWLGPANGTFGDSTEQAVYAFQKTAWLERDGTVGLKTEAALQKGARPPPARLGLGYRGRPARRRRDVRHQWQARLGFQHLDGRRLQLLLPEVRPRSPTPLLATSVFTPKLTGWSSTGWGSCGDRSTSTTALPSMGTPACPPYPSCMVVCG